MKRLLIIFFLLFSVCAFAQTSVPTYELITVSGTDTYTATVSPSPALVNGYKKMFKFTNANSGAATFNLNSTGAITLRTSDGTALSGGEIVAGSVWWLVYDGTASQWRLSGGSGSGGGGITIGTTTITSGTNTRVLYNNSGVVGEYTISGTGNVAMTTSPTFTTPILGTPTSGTLTNATGYLLNNIANPTGTTTLALSTNPLIFTSGVTTGTGATAGVQMTFNSLTSGTGLDISSNSTAAASDTQTLISASQTGANGTSGETTYTAWFSDTKTGTTSSNVALRLDASGGTYNAGLWVSSGKTLLGGGNPQFSTGFVLNVQSSLAGDFVVFEGAGGTDMHLFNTSGQYGLGNSGGNRLIVLNVSGNGASVFGSHTITAGSVLVDFQSTTLGVVFPRMTTTQKNAVATPVAGMVVYDTTLGKLCIYTTAWETITSL